MENDLREMIDHFQIRKLLAKYCRGTNLQRWTRLPRGGHFSFWEQPELLGEELRAFFRPLHGAG